eukprot:TRINITY_DN8352_c0_g1_i1.p1 TRINITY_DN8352_c0_g1~~TRINITY_DN8352_c0_g1_i1.p1  ORF type:complete len:376 (-),score=88.19 TRINITY_DN8352_c0_g1_i1:448-1575(-)
MDTRTFDARARPLTPARQQQPPTYDEESGEDSGEDDFEALEKMPADFSDDTYSMFVVQFVSDAHHMSSKNLPRHLIMSRFFVSTFLIILTVALQLLLLYQVKRFVSAGAVHDIRIAYHKFEVQMYTNLSVYDKSFDPASSGAEVIPDLHFRGDPKYFNPARFETMQDDIKEEACKIPLSEPFFFWLILFLWTSTVIQELRRTTMVFKSVVMNTITSDSMRAAYEGAYNTAAEEGVRVIEQLTLPLKVVLSLMFAVRAGMALYLLWVGCRWLLGTNCFADLILNAIALEFILLVKDTIYYAFMPNRFRSELEMTKMVPDDPRQHADCCNCISVLLWFTFAAVWVTGYMYAFQQVLPNYQWDVHDVCAEWIAARFSV